MNELSPSDGLEDIYSPSLADDGEPLLARVGH